MKILIVSRSAQDLEGAGGRTRIVSELRDAIGETHDCALLCLVSARRFLRPRSLLRARRRLSADAGCPTWYVPRAPTFGSPMLRRVSRALEALVVRVAVWLGSYEVCHAHTTSAAAIALRARGAGGRFLVVADLHGAAGAEYRHKLGPRADPGEVDRLASMSRRAVEQADLCIFVSEAMRAHYEARYGPCGERAVVIPCATTMPDLAPKSRERTREALGLQGRFVCVYLGSWRAYQCAEETIAMFARLRERRQDAFLLLITGHPEAFGAALAERGVRAQDAMIRTVPHAEVASLLSAGDLAFLLREDDVLNQVASPTKFAEYLACGLPVLITPHVGDFSDLVARDGLGEVVSLDESGERLEGIVRRIAAERDALGLRCAETARERLTWDQAGPALREAYERLQARTPS